MEVISLLLQLAPSERVLEAMRIAYPDWPSESAQESFAALLCREYCVRCCEPYPQPTKYTKHFFKCVERSILSTRPCIASTDDGGSMDNFCSDMAAVEDSLMDLIISAQIAGSYCRPDDDDIGYVGFFDLSMKSVKHLRVLRSHNQVGTRVWAAGIYLAEVLLRSPSILAGRCVVELGAGIGITGVLLSSGPTHSRPSKIVMTDFHPDVVTNLKHNIYINNPCGGHDDDDDTPCSTACVLEAAVLDWSAAVPGNFLQYGASVMIAADCTYCEGSNVHLVSAMLCFLTTMTMREEEEEASQCVSKLQWSFRLGNSDDDDSRTDSRYLPLLLSQQQPFVLVACTVRHEDTFLHFLQLCVDRGLRVEDLTLWARLECLPATPAYHYPESIDGIKLLCIHLD